ncbi:MAG: hypothetical protein CMO26_06015 [Thiotrichales bacterium]|nr:hypothetical protein [Thiotrichales bacterium]
MNSTTPSWFKTAPLAQASFGASFALPKTETLADLIEKLERSPDVLPSALTAAEGLLVLKHFDAITDDPQLLVRLSRLMGPEVENYHETTTPTRLIHDKVPEIIKISNLPPMNFDVPELPDPPLTESGEIPVQFPHRRGWHTDQSFRRPPPDVSLFYAKQPCPKGQGQTLYANGTAAYAALSDEQKQRIDGRYAIHAIPWTGRGEDEVRRGETPKPLQPHQASQRQPIVRTHPVSKRPALYMCEEGQLDWVIGPIEGLSPGPDADGAALVYELMSHYTRKEFTYAHDWDRGDLLIHDNRNLVHSATWFDAKRHGRLMWRTTVMGNAGDEYSGECKSWIPVEGEEFDPEVF